MSYFLSWIANNEHFQIQNFNFLYAPHFLINQAKQNGKEKRIQKYKSGRFFIFKIKATNTIIRNWLYIYDKPTKIQTKKLQERLKSHDPTQLSFKKWNKVTVRRNIKREKTQESPDPRSWQHSNQNQKQKRKATSVQPSTKLHGSCHEQTPKVVVFQNFSHLGLCFSHSFAQLPPCSNQKAAGERDGSALVSTWKGPAFCELCSGQLGVLRSFCWERWFGNIAEKPLLRCRELAKTWVWFYFLSHRYCWLTDSVFWTYPDNLCY